MDRKKQLELCKKCNHKDFNLDQGIICGISGAKPDFEDSCEHFSENISLTRYSRSDEEENLDNLKRFIKLFLKGRFVVTPVVLLVSMILFFVSVRISSQAFQPDTMSLIKLGGNFKTLTLDGQYWRLLTAIFLHGNIVHLLFNMYAFIAIGFLLERQIGSLRMMLAFLVNSLVASSASIFWSDYNMSVGASGAVFGMFGIYLVLLTADIMEKKSRLIILLSMLFYVVYSIVSGLKPGIDVAAHVGGLISGGLIGLFLRPTFVRKERRKLVNIVFALGLIINMSFVVAILSKEPGAKNRFNKYMYEIGIEEQEAANVLVNLVTQDFDSKIELVRGNVMPRFRKCRRLADEAGDIEDLSEDLVLYANLVKDYCSYSLSFFEMSLIVDFEGKQNYRYIYNYLESRRNKLLSRINPEATSESIDFEDPMEEFLESIPESLIIVVDGTPFPDREELLKYDPLNITATRSMQMRLARQRYGDAYSGAVLMETRDMTLHRIDTLQSGFHKNYLMKAYGLSKQKLLR